jgi:VanZ family protein
MLPAMSSNPPRAASVSGRAALTWVPAVAWAGLIFVASAQQNLTFVPDSDIDFVVRKTGHMVVFGILALLTWRALAATTSLRRPWAWAVVLAVLYAVTDELHQGGVAGRSASAVDVAIDAAGVLVAVALVGFVASRRRGRSGAPPGKGEVSDVA